MTGVYFHLHSVSHTLEIHQSQIKNQGESCINIEHVQMGLIVITP